MLYQLCTDPGALMDMYYTFVLHFNQDLWESHFADTPSDLTYYRQLTDELGPVDPACAIFFKQKDFTTSFFSRMILVRRLQRLGGQISLSSVLEVLSDQDTPLSSLMWDFWTSNAPMPDDPREIVRYISTKITCDAKTRQLLISYFSDPAPYDEALRRAISDKYQTVLAMRKKREPEVLGHIASLRADPDAFIRPAFDAVRCEQLPDTQYVSFCSLHKKIIYVYQSPNIVLLGLDYQETAARGQADEPITKATALHDGDRNRILQYILRAGEASIHEVSAALKIPLDAASYHLVILDQAKILTPRQTAATTFYRFRAGISDDLATVI